MLPSGHLEGVGGIGGPGSVGPPVQETTAHGLGGGGGFIGGGDLLEVAADLWVDKPAELSGEDLRLAVSMEGLLL